MKKILSNKNKVISNHKTYKSRNRTNYFLLTGVVIGTGLASRKFSGVLHDSINLYLGDTLWALMIYLMIAFLLPRQSIVKVAVLSLAFCFIIEISQLYHAPWIDAIRSTRLGGLVLGFGFLWSDLLAYSMGVALGAIFERIFLPSRQLSTE